MSWLFHPVVWIVSLLGLAGLRRQRAPLTLVLGLLGLLLSAGCAARLASTDGFHFLQLFSVAVFIYLPLYLLAASLLVPPATALAGRALAAGIAFVGAWSFWIEPYWLEVERVELRSSKLDAPLRIAVLADFQTDRFGAYERRALDTLQAQNADLVLLTGDYLQIEPRRYDELAKQLRDYLRTTGFAAPMGVYAVRGDVEHDDWRELFRGLPIHTYEKTTTIELPPLTITALAARDSRFGAPPIAPSERFQVVFGHAPDFARNAPAADLLVAGHTHGGQVRLPFLGPIMTLSRVPRSWAAGTTKLPGGQTLVVSRGVGMERGSAPQLRFLCRPQIVVIDLLPAVP